VGDEEFGEARGGGAGAWVEGVGEVGREDREVCEEGHVL
jgi:hypothetical protein